MKNLLAEIALNDQAGEKILHKCRYHFMFVKSYWVRFIVFLLIAFLIFDYQNYSLDLSKGRLLVLIPLLIAITYWFYAYLIYKNSLFIITNQRLILVDRQGFFKKVIQDIPLANITKISLESRGMLAAWLNFADLNITLRDGAVNLKAVAKSRQVRRKLNDVLQTYV